MFSVNLCFSPYQTPENVEKKKFSMHFNLEKKNTECKRKMFLVNIPCGY